MSSISCIVAQLTVTLDKSMPVFFSRPFQSQTFSLTLNQMHVGVFSDSVFHLENLLFPPDISLNACLCVVFCLLAPWTLQHKSKSVITSRIPSMPLQQSLVQLRMYDTCASQRLWRPPSLGMQVSLFVHVKGLCCILPQPQRTGLRYISA